MCQNFVTFPSTPSTSKIHLHLIHRMCLTIAPSSRTLTPFHIRLYAIHVCAIKWLCLFIYNGGKMAILVFLTRLNPCHRRHHCDISLHIKLLYVTMIFYVVCFCFDKPPPNVPPQVYFLVSTWLN